jgi:hypothetical protein
MMWESANRSPLSSFSKLFIGLFLYTSLIFLFLLFIPSSLISSFRYFLFLFLKCRPPLWSSGQSFWLQIQRSWVRVLALPNFLKSSGSGTGSTLENREYSYGGPLCWPRDTLYPQKLALTSPTCSDRSVGIVRLRTKTTECSWNTCWLHVIRSSGHLHLFHIDPVTTANLVTVTVISFDCLWVIFINWKQ